MRTIHAMATENILTLTDDTFDEQIQNVEEPLLVDFWAEWCGPCKLLAPTIERISEEMIGRVRVAKVNVDDNGDLANRFGIRSIPTLMIFKGGRVVDQIVGNVPREQIRRVLEKPLICRPPPPLPAAPAGGAPGASSRLTRAKAAPKISRTSEVQRCRSEQQPPRPRGRRRGVA